MKFTALRRIVAGGAIALLLVSGNVAPASAPVSSNSDSTPRIVALRRLTESEYRNSIADIFGPDIVVAGRFEPIIRPTHQLIATGASASTVSPAGLEQFDAIARGIASQVFDESHRVIFAPCEPAQPRLADPACARRTLAPIGRYLFRRPLTQAELTLYVDMAGNATTAAGSYYGGMQLALSAMLVSPNFLYVIEAVEPDPVHPGGLRMDGYSRAARLSYLLWNTTPNDALLTAAAQGKLTDPAQLSTIAASMVRSPRLEDGVRAFFTDMLIFEKFDDIAKDPIVYPRFNQDVAKALPEQMLRTIVDELVTRAEPYPDLFTTRRTFMTRALGPVYDVPVHVRTGWEPYEFAPGDGRAGLLAQAGFLALYSHSGRSSPTLRGRAIREVLLCQPVPNPPGNVNFSVVQDTTNPVLRTARARLGAHANDPVCASCHRIIDPIGLPLETFDGIGAFRRQENGVDIDVSGTFSGVSFNGVVGLGGALATNSSTTSCAVSRLLEYAVGHPSDDDADAVDALEKSFAADGYRFPALMLRIATLPSAYQLEHAAGAPPSTAPGPTQ
jgi:hypothetical protein